MPKPADFVQEPLITLEAFEDLLASLHPFSAVLGIEILDIGFGNATLRLPPNNSNQRLGGMVAGPMLMGLADLALYAAIVGATGNPNAVTASLTINFLRKAPPGGILAHATILKTGRMSAGQVLLVPDEGGDPVAQVISTWSVPRRS
ncbi:PaaI family thioesterase [Alcaligenaceae bacterium CGII-47]|nr:PaaI family thioesterase [Alcaligenaceae bacterium CGII-47]